MKRQTACWLTAIVFTALVLAKFSPQTGFTSLIRFGETWQDRRHTALQGLPLVTIPDSSGYDGQFYAQIALDPLLQSGELEKVIDAPPYRARRILVPALAAILGVGQAWWVVQIYSLINVFCWFTLGSLLYRQIGNLDGLAFARWSGCMLSMGVLDSVRQSLVDLPALLLLALAITKYARPKISVSWLGLAGLAKETSLLGAVALQFDHTVRPFPWRRVGVSLLVASLPLGLWWLYVRQHLPGTSGQEGLGNFTWPLYGLLIQAKHSLGELVLGNFDGRHSFGLIALVGLLVQAWSLWSNRQLSNPWWRVGAAYSLLFLVLGSWVWSGYWAVCRAVLPMTIAFNLLLPASSRFWPVWIIGNLTILHAVWRFL